MLISKFWTDQDDEALELTLKKEVESAWIKAMQAPYPESTALLDRVYFQGAQA